MLITILTLEKLQELIALNQTDKIKMLTCGYETKGLHSFKINPQQYEYGKGGYPNQVFIGTYYNINWSTDEGDPNITLKEGELIENCADTSDGDYLYTLYITE